MLFLLIFVAAVLSSIGPNMVFWSIMGLLRFLAESKFNHLPGQSHRFALKDIAVVIAAHNEEMALPSCLLALRTVIGSKQIFVADDASKDATRAIAKAGKCNVFTAKSNVGKAKAIEGVIEKFKLTRKFRAILILDADSEIDSNYFNNGLPLFDDPNVAVVAGHVISRPANRGWNAQQIIHAYRVRLYFVVQALLKFGQTWRPANVTFVAPGFASMYRTDVLEKLTIAESGLILDDINMTFQVHHSNLGRVAYSPSVKCSTEDPATLKDYSKQIKRWNLGLWQTVRKQKVWAGKFWFALSLQLLELVTSSLFVMLLPLAFISCALWGGDIYLFSAFQGRLQQVPYWTVPALFFASDILLSVISAILLRRIDVLVLAPFFPIIRFYDAVWTLVTIPMAFVSKSDGRWKSPSRILRIPVA